MIIFDFQFPTEGEGPDIRFPEIPGAEGGIQKSPFCHLPRHLQLNFTNRVFTSVYAVAKCCHP
jgi:hypothetical protein